MRTKTWKEAYKPSWQQGSSDFDCYAEGLTSLEGAPSVVHGDLDCSYNKLISLEGAPSFIGNTFYCQHNELTSLKDIHLQIKHIGKNADFQDNPIKSHVLGVLLIEALHRIGLDNKRVQNILNAHLPSKGMEDVLLAQEELIIAGLEEYAQL